jgi:hypothetical protein
VLLESQTLIFDGHQIYICNAQIDLSEILGIKIGKRSKQWRCLTDQLGTETDLRERR